MKRNLFLLIMGFIFIPSLIFADTWTQTSDTDFNAGTKSSVQVTGNSVILDFSSPALSNAGGGTWKYRKPITIDNSIGGALTNYEVSVTTDTAVLIAADKMNSDGSDIRFTDSDGTTELKYWIETGINTTTTKIWVKVPSILASSTKTIYIYYGNSSATSSSNGSNTFNFFDDFTGTSLSSSWTATGACSVSGSSATITTGAVHTNATVGSSPQNSTFEALVNYNILSVSQSGICINNSQSGTTNNSESDALAYNVSASGSNTNLVMYGADGTAASFNIVNATTLYGSLSVNPNYIIGFSFVGTTQMTYFITTSTYNVTGDYVNLKSRTYGPTPAKTWDYPYFLWLGYITGSASSGNNNIDDIEVGWVRVHQYTATVPTTSAGSEQNNYASSGTLTSSIYDCTKSSVFGTMTWTDSGVQTVSMKVRTSNDSGMSGATAWASCPAVTKGQDISSLSSVTNSHRYIQYQATLSTSDTTQTPTLNDVSINYTPDSTPPSSVLNVPANGVSINSLTTVSGTASDSLSGVANVKITIKRNSDNKYWDGDSWETGQTWLTCSGTTSWSYTYTPDADGTYTIQSKATDVAGNEESTFNSTNTHTFNYDTTKPSSSITAPANSSNINSLTAITGTASDNLSGVSTVEISIRRSSDSKYWDGDSWETSQTWLSCAGTTSWTYAYTPDANGTYTVQSRATDVATNVETPGAGSTFVYNTSMPVSSISAPTNGATLNSMTNITGTATAASGTTITQVEVAIKRSSDNKYWTGVTWGAAITWLVCTGTTSWSYTYTPNANNTYTVQSRATDSATNVETPATGNTFVFDNSIPVSTITNPANNAIINSLSSITGTASPGAGAAITKVEISLKRISDNKYWDGSAWGASQTWLLCSGTTSWSYTYTPEANGIYLVQSRATNAASTVETPATGNTFTYNTSKPVSYITTPADSSKINTLTTITGTSLAVGVTSTKIEISIKRNSDSKYWDGDSWETSQTWLTATGTTNWTYTYTPNGDDTYTIQSRATDVASNVETPSSGNTFTYDSTAPAAIGDLAVSIGAHQGYVDLTWTAPSDATSGTSSYTVKYATYNILNSPAGTSDSWWTNATTFSQSWAVSSSGTTESHTVTGLTSGLNYYFAIKTTDNAGNVSSISNQPSGSTNSPPTVTVTYPSASGITLGSLSTAGVNAGRTTVNIYWDLNDLNSADTHTFNVQVSSNSGVSFTTVASNLPNGTTYYSWNTLNHNNLIGKYRVKVIGSDEGNMTGEDTSDNSFSINNENFAPTVTVTYPNGEESLGGDVTITWTHSDPNTNDGHTFEILYSTNSGTTFTSLVNNLSDNVNSYNWPTTLTPDSNYYKIKVIATDDGTATGYPSKSGEDTSDTIFSVNNFNDAPNAFNLLSPTDGGTETSLTPVLDWEDGTDPDAGQTLTYTLYIASDVNFSNIILTKTGITVSRYLVTASDGLQDGHTYYWKVKVADNGVPQLPTYSTQTNWNFKIENAVPKVNSTLPVNNTKALPSEISSVTIIFNKRIDETTLSTTNISFVNEENVAVSFSIAYDDVNRTLTLTPDYSLVSSNIFTITLTTGVKDLMGTGLASNYSFSFTTLIEAAQGVVFTNKDGTVKVVVEPDILPSNSYIKLTEATSANSTSVKAANETVLSDATLKSAPGIKTYQLQALDTNDQLITSFNGNVTLTLGYPDTDSDGYVDNTNIKESFLRMCKINEGTNKWELVSGGSQNTTTNKISASIGSFSVYTILAYKAPSDTLSGVMNFPNPFEAGKQSTTIVYVLNKNCKVTIKIYNLVGDLVRKLEYESGSEGGKGASGGYTNRVTWNGRNGDGMIVANGGYIAQIIAEPADGGNTVKEIRKIAVVK